MQKSALPYMRILLNDEFQCKQKTIEEMIYWKLYPADYSLVLCSSERQIVWIVLHLHSYCFYHCVNKLYFTLLYWMILSDFPLRVKNQEFRPLRSLIGKESRYFQIFFLMANENQETRIKVLKEEISRIKKQWWRYTLKKCFVYQHCFVCHWHIQYSWNYHLTQITFLCL